MGASCSSGVVGCSGGLSHSDELVFDTVGTQKVIPGYCGKVTALLGCKCNLSSAALSLDGDNEASGPSSSRADRSAKVGIRIVTQLLQENRVLDAEFVLAQALKRLEDAGDVQGAAWLCQEPCFRAVARRVCAYDSVGVMMDQLSGRVSDPGGFALQWEKKGARLWLSAEPGATWFKTRVAIPLEAPLHQCLVASHELDLMPRWMSSLAQVPEPLAKIHRFRQVVYQLQNVMMFKMDVVYEVMRMVNKSYGMLMETMRSEFPLDGITMPERGWITKRVEVAMTSIWLPLGGDSVGTILVQEAHVDLGFQVPSSMLQMLIDGSMPSFLDDFRKGAAMVTEALAAEKAGAVGELAPWLERLRRDDQGLYAELREAESAAAMRAPITMDALPGSEVTARPNLSREQHDALAQRMREAAEALPKDADAVSSAPGSPTNASSWGGPTSATSECDTAPNSPTAEGSGDPKDEGSWGLPGRAVSFVGSAPGLAVSFLPIETIRSVSTSILPIETFRSVSGYKLVEDTPGEGPRAV